MKKEIYTFMCPYCTHEWKSNKTSKKYSLGELCPKCKEYKIILKKVEKV